MVFDSSKAVVPNLQMAPGEQDHVDAARRMRSLSERFGAGFDFAPDAALDALDPAAVEWVRDRVDEFHAALMACPGAVTYDPGGIEFERDLDRAAERWAAAWNAQPEATPFCHALDNALAVMYQRQRILPGFRNAERLREMGEIVLGRSIGDGDVEVVNAKAQPHHDVVVGMIGAEYFWHEPIRNDANGPVTSSPSPWAPLLALWERGAWPLLLPDGAVLFFVRVMGVQQGVSSRRPKPALTSEPLPALISLGLAGPPQEWFMSKAGPPTPFSVPPFDQSMRLGGAVAVVSPVVVIAATGPTNIQDAPTGADGRGRSEDQRPWYKRWFGL